MKLNPSAIQRGGWGLHTSHITEFERIIDEMTYYILANKGSIKPTTYRTFLNDLKRDFDNLKNVDKKDTGGKKE